MMRILVIRYRFIGDTVLMIPFLRNLRQAYPDAKIDALVGAVSGEVLTECPYIDELIVFDTTRKHKYENAKQEKKSFFSYVKLLKGRNYDKAYVLKRSFSSAALAFLAGIKQRIGFNTEGRGFLLTQKIPYVKDRHEVECFLDVLRADNIPVNRNHLENWTSRDSEAKINTIFKELYLNKNGFQKCEAKDSTRFLKTESQINKKTIINVTDGLKVLIHATSGNVNKQWNPEYFAEVVTYLVNNLGARVFYTGTQKDAEIYDEIRSLIKEDLIHEPVNLCGKLSIQGSTALIGRMDFAIGSDSGTLHIAASMNVPVIGIYGPMNYKKWQAFGEIHEPVHLDLPCMPCELRKKCPRSIACLQDLKPAMVIKKVDKLVNSKNCGRVNS